MAVHVISGAGAQRTSVTIGTNGNDWLKQKECASLFETSRGAIHALQMRVLPHFHKKYLKRKKRNPEGIQPATPVPNKPARPPRAPKDLRSFPHGHAVLCCVRQISISIPIRDEQRMFSMSPRLSHKTIKLRGCGFSWERQRCISSLSRTRAKQSFSLKSHKRTRCLFWLFDNRLFVRD